MIGLQATIRLELARVGSWVKRSANTVKEAV
jgi:hypothetical protein